jgi:hypothetical protein
MPEAWAVSTAAAAAEAPEVETAFPGSLLRAAQESIQGVWPQRGGSMELPSRELGERGLGPESLHSAALGCLCFGYALIGWFALRLLVSLQPTDRRARSGPSAKQGNAARSACTERAGCSGPAAHRCLVGLAIEGLPPSVRPENPRRARLESGTENSAARC